MELAQAMHHIFSAFDTSVQAVNLFKMDTVGDAFIVAGWLSSSDGEEEAEQAGRVGGMRAYEAVLGRVDTQRAKVLCQKMLWLAHRMLYAVANYRTAGTLVFCLFLFPSLAFSLSLSLSLSLLVCLSLSLSI